LRCRWTPIPVLLFAAALFHAIDPRATADDAQQPTPIDEPPLTDDDRDHWSWQPLVRPAIPAVQDAAECRNPIDQFVAAKLEAKGLQPLPPADRLTLLRRLSFDLAGLPPTPDEANAFLADNTADAYERLVDRLLASPAYGERWGQHWLDLARYADSDGFEHDKFRPEAWRYRDWVIDALNADMPYDRFVQLQLAGDELVPGDAQAAVATGFCLCGPDMPDINSQDERRHMVMSDITATVGAVFLGLQVGCAQCHDHKSDPISQADFYRLRACFDPAVPLKDTPAGRVLSEPNAAAPPSYFWIRGDYRRRGPPVEPAFPRIANAAGHTIAPPAPDAKSSGRRAALARWLTRPDHPLTARVIVNRLWQGHFGRGLSTTPSDFGRMGEPPSHPELLDWLATELVAREWSLKQMHRLIVTSATYRRASRPTEPGWSQAQTAAAKAAWEAGQKLDQTNELLWRMNRQRLDAESTRDAMLAVSGVLNRRQGGPGVMVPLPKEVLATSVAADWKPHDDAQEHVRRSVYLLVRRSLKLPLLEALDRPDTNESCPRRGRSTTAPQALALLNSRMSLECAERLAGFAYQMAGDDTARLTICFRRALGRAPSNEELAWLREFWSQQTTLLRAHASSKTPLAAPLPPPDADRHEAAALVHVSLALLNVNEFVYVD
jgi:hypothetical protein